MPNVLEGEPQLLMKMILAKPWTTVRLRQCIRSLIITSSLLLHRRHFHRIPKVNKCFKCILYRRGGVESSFGEAPRSFRICSEALKVRADS